ALAGEFLHVPEVGPAGGWRLQGFGVVGQDRGPHEGAHATVFQGAAHQVALVQDRTPVDVLVQAFLAAAAQVAGLDLDGVPDDVLGLDHGLDLGLFTVVGDGGEIGSASCRGRV